MIAWTLDRLSRALEPVLAAGARPAGRDPLGGISTDTRTLAPGDTFVALRGERFDGHDFLAQAVGRGAAALVVDDPRRAAGLGRPVLAVADTTRRRSRPRLAARGARCTTSGHDARGPARTTRSSRRGTGS